MWRDRWRDAICRSTLNRRICPFLLSQLAAQHCSILSNCDARLNPGSSAPSPGSSNLSDTVHDLHSLEELRLTGCAQVGAGGLPVWCGKKTNMHGRVLRRPAGGSAKYQPCAPLETLLEGITYQPAPNQQTNHPQPRVAASHQTRPPTPPHPTPPHPPSCPQVTTLRLQSQRLSRLELCGTRALQELEMRCSRLADVVIQPLNPGLAACAALKWVAGTVGIVGAAGRELARGCCRHAAARKGAQHRSLGAACWVSVQHDSRPPPGCSPFNMY